MSIMYLCFSLPGGVRWSGDDVYGGRAALQLHLQRPRQVSEPRRGKRIQRPCQSTDRGRYIGAIE